MAFFTGATPKEDDGLSLKSELGGEEIPEKVVNWWNFWSATRVWDTCLQGWPSLRTSTCVTINLGIY